MPFLYSIDHCIDYCIKNGIGIFWNTLSWQGLINGVNHVIPCLWHMVVDPMDTPSLTRNMQQRACWTPHAAEGSPLVCWPPLDTLASRQFTPRPRQGVLTLTTLAARTGSGGQGHSRGRSPLTRAPRTGLPRRGRLDTASVWLGPARPRSGVQVGLDTSMFAGRKPPHRYGCWVCHSRVNVARDRACDHPVASGWTGRSMVVSSARHVCTVQGRGS